MIGVCFLMGLLGSAHCLGMCGALAFGVSSLPVYGMRQQLSRAAIYNSGRVLSYAGLGLLVGTLADAAIWHEWQTSLSFVMGGFLIVLSLLSLDLEKLLHRSSWVTSYYKQVQSFIGSALKTRAAQFPLAVGGLNGLLPCGMVYLALAAGVSTASAMKSALCMTAFGLGTFPLMFLLMIIPTRHPMFRSIRRVTSRILPFCQAGLGIYLIYRGISASAPVTLNYWIAILNPTMCH